MPTIVFNFAQASAKVRETLQGTLGPECGHPHR